MISRTDAARTLLRVAPASLVPHPAQARQTRNAAALRSLAESIAAVGLLQPIVAVRVGEELMVVAGERRRQAAIMAGLDEIDVLVISGSATEISLIENVQRRNLGAIDLADAMEQLRRTEGHTHETLAWMTGRSRSSTSELLSIARLPSSIKAACRNSDLPKSLLIEIAKQPTVAEMEALLAGITSGTLTTTNVRAHSRQWRNVAVRQSVTELPRQGATRARLDSPLHGASADGRPWLQVARPADFWVDELTWRLCLRNLSRREPTLLCGPTGCGKTELVRHLAAAAGRAVYAVNMGATTDPRLALIGTTHYNGRQTVFHRSQMVVGLEDPRALILLDEITRSAADAGHLLFPLLDDQRSLMVDEADPPVLIDVHPDVAFFATANVGVEYTGTRVLDRALLDRFLIIHLDYPPAEAESDMLTMKTGISRPMSRRLVAVARHCRKDWRQETLSTPISTRDILKAARLIVDGFEPVTALEIALVALFDDTAEKTAVRQVIQRF